MNSKSIFFSILALAVTVFEVIKICKKYDQCSKKQVDISSQRTNI